MISKAMLFFFFEGISNAIVLVCAGLIVGVIVNYSGTRHQCTTALALGNILSET